MGEGLRTYLAELTASRPDDLLVMTDGVNSRFGVTAVIERLEDVR